MSTISIIPLVIGSVLLFAAGSGLISEKYPLLVGLGCFLLFAFIEGLSFKKSRLTDEQRWKSHHKINYEEKKSSVA
jgi:membrane-bound ClpP family serine protease